MEDIDHFATFLLVVGLIVPGLIAWGVFFLIKDSRNRYREGGIGYYREFLAAGTFTAESSTGFKLQYYLALLCERVDNAEFNRALMLEQSSKARLAASYNREYFQPFLEQNACFFTFGATQGGDSHAFALCVLRQLVCEKDKLFFKTILPGDLVYDLLRPAPKYRNYGSETVLTEFRIVISKDIIEENYAMLTDEQKRVLLANKEYIAREERLAVALLKRRLDFFDSNEQRHETDELLIETAKAGRGVRIKWRFKSNAPANYVLQGYRNTGGFFHDELDDKNNGALVVHSRKSDETVELLDEDTAYFYTFYLRSEERDTDGEYIGVSPIRFQVTIGKTNEIIEVRAILERYAGKTSADPRANMSQAIEELGLVMEFHDAMDTMERDLVAKIKSKRLPTSEEDEKIEFVRDAVRLQREKYQP